MKQQIKYRLLLLLIIIGTCGFSQGEGNQWYFGHGVALDFNSGTPIVKPGNQMNNTEGTASIADCDGNLLFYTDGVSVWDKSNKIMSNGSGLDGNSFSTQSALIVKRPASSGTYYIFTGDDQGFSYSTVNMSSNGGMGAVVSKNFPLGFSGTQKINVTRHANGQDVWVLTHYDNNNRFDAFLVTSAGVSSSPVSSYSGPQHTSGHGDLKISPNGDKILTCVEFMDFVSLSDFDNSTGIVSNTNFTNKFPQPHGGEFSANGQLAYVSSACFPISPCANTGISQLNLGAGSPSLIWSSSIVISGKIWGSMRRHTNGIIYCADDDSKYLGAIYNPNVLGKGSNYVHNAVYLGGKKCGWELPNDVLVSSSVIPGIDFSITPGTCPQDDYSFKIISSQPVISASWNFDDPTSGFSNFSSIINPIHTFSGPGTYNISVTINIDGCHTTTLNKSITVYANPKAIAGPDVSICTGTKAKIGTTGSSNYTYSWSPTAGLSNGNIANPDITKTNNTLSDIVTTYHLTTSWNNCKSYDTVIVTIKPLPPVDAGNDKAFCSGDTFQLGVASDPAVATYLWTPNVGLNNSNISDPLLTLSSNNLSTIYYHLNVTGINGCKNSDSSLITVYPLPDAGEDDKYVCPGDSVQLIAVGNGTSYAWYPNKNISDTTIYNPMVWPISPQYYYLNVTDVNGCHNIDSVFVNSTGTVPTSAGEDKSICINDSVMIGGTPSGPTGTTYSWQPVTGLSNSHIANPMASPSDTTTYILYTQNDTCVGIDSMVIFVHPLPVVDAGINTEICLNDTTQLHATGALSYVWSPATNINNSTSSEPLVFPKKTTTYKVTGTDIYACKNIDSVIIKVNPLPPANAGLDTGLCIHDTIQLNASGGISYLWSPSAGLDSSAIHNPHAFPEKTTVYTVEVTDTNGCKLKDTINVTVHPLPIIATLSNTLICEGSSINLWATGGTKYHWWPTESLSDSTVSNPKATPLTPTTYFVEVTDSYQCKDTASFDITLNVVPTAEFSVVKQTPGCEGFRTEFTNTSINDDTQLWLYGDGTSSTEKVPQHTYAFGKNVETSLIVTNNGLCSDTMTIPINNKDIFDIISVTNGNVLTLNNDGLNECFTVSVKDEFQNCFLIQIYNRWGLLMYKSDDYTECWNGKRQANNQWAHPGTYYYVISINEYSKTGYITVFGDE